MPQVGVIFKWKLLVLYPTIEKIISVLKIVPCKSEVSKIVHVIYKRDKIYYIYLCFIKCFCLSSYVVFVYIQSLLGKRSKTYRGASRRRTSLACILWLQYKVSSSDAL